MSLRDFFPKICNFITIDNVLDNDKAMKKTCMFRGKINAGFFFYLVLQNGLICGEDYLLTPLNVSFRMELCVEGGISVRGGDYLRNSSVFPLT